MSRQFVFCLQCNAQVFFSPSNPRRYCSKTCKGSHMSRPAVERFWLHVNKTDGCWFWIGGKTKGGYGVFHPKNGVTAMAHRFSWEHHFGPIPDGIEVCHNCPGGDNRSCVNPSHLWLGSRQDNATDAAAKNRMRWTKTTPNDVREIRRRRSSGESVTDIAKVFGITKSTVSKICLRQTRRTVSDE